MALETIFISTALNTISLVGRTLWMIPLLIAGINYFNYSNVDPEAPVIDRRNLYSEYDFVIIGGGAAGAVVASRLSEISSWKVLLLEAGPDENEITDVPSLAAYLQLTRLDWQYKIEPNGRACLGMRGQRCNWPRGKVLGGSSTLNYMIYVRGNRNDYDTWESMGNPGWGYEDILKYFIKSEDNRNPFLAKSKYHGTGGLQTVQESPWRTPLVLAFVQAGKELGYPNQDINGQEQYGFMIAQGTIRRGSRCSTSKAFLRPIRLRQNLHIALNSHVTKILINPTTRRAYGVEFFRNGRKQVVLARKEVILSAGSINSPQLMMLSGLGPGEHLKENGIPVIKDLPGVGGNMQDHVGMGGLTFLIDKPVSIVQDRFQAFPMTMEYVINERGPMTTIGGVEGVAFIDTPYGNRSWPDVQFHMAPASINSDAGQKVRNVLGLTEELYDTVYRPIANKDSWTIMPLLLRPRSKGTVRLHSKNPFEYPIIDANYFADPLDVKTLVEGIKIAIRVSEAPAFKQFGTRLHRIPLPNCKHIPFASDEYWECHLRTISMTIYHPIGTCKMGPDWDEEAVVDPRLRVYGIKGLRIIDASVMPTMPSGNTNAPTIMVAEKGSDLIKEDWLRSSL